MPSQNGRRRDLPQRQSATVSRPASISLPSWSRSRNGPRTSSGPSRYGVIVTSSSGIATAVPARARVRRRGAAARCRARAARAARRSTSGSARRGDAARRRARRAPRRAAAGASGRCASDAIRSACPERSSSIPHARARRAVAAGERGGVDLQAARRRPARRATAPLGISISSAQRSGWPISVPNPRARSSAVASRKPAASPNSGASISTQRRPGGPVGDRVELRGRRARARRRGRARRRVRTSSGDAGGVERRLHLAHARGQLAEDAGASRSRTCGVTVTTRRAVGHGEPRELDGVVEVDGAVVDAGQQVEVELGALHVPLTVTHAPRRRLRPWREPREPCHNLVKVRYACFGDARLPGRHP